MLLSVFTPSHDARHLEDCFKCLRDQTYSKWEWIVLANGEKRDQVLNTATRFATIDSRVRAIKSDLKGVGALKRAACEAATGDAFVEYDHDDLLTDDCLDTIAKSLAGKKEAFLYSDDAQIDHNHNSNHFRLDYGWEHYDWTYKGKKYLISRAFCPINPRSLCEILYAPDHVRVWTRDAYTKVGGHNPAMAIADDHELMIRTYLAGCEFIFVPRPLYFHRQDGLTTSQVRIEEIGQISRGLRDKHLYALIAEWLRRTGKPAYSIGEELFPGGAIKVIGKHEPDWAIKNMATRKPIQDNSAACFVASEYLQTIPKGRISSFFSAVYKLLIPGGFFLTFTPAAEDEHGRVGRGAYQDERHLSIWTPNNFLYYTHRNFSRYTTAACRFQTVRQHLGYPSKWHEDLHIPYITWDGMALRDDHLNRLAGFKDI